jgi:hypothetical protein
MKPLAVFALPIRTSKQHRARKRLHVFIWKHVKDLRQAAKALDTSWNWNNAAGCYLATRGNNQFGQIHLWQKLMGAGYFAHELHHFMLDYSSETESADYVFDRQANERMAWLAGELTAQFWTKFYERFEVK